MRDVLLNHVRPIVERAAEDLFPKALARDGEEMVRLIWKAALGARI